MEQGALSDAMARYLQVNKRMPGWEDPPSRADIQVGNVKGTVLCNYSTGTCLGCAGAIQDKMRFAHPDGHFPFRRLWQLLIPMETRSLTKRSSGR